MSDLVIVIENTNFVLVWNIENLLVAFYSNFDRAKL
jgi:hypothetical protein